MILIEVRLELKMNCGLMLFIIRIISRKLRKDLEFFERYQKINISINMKTKFYFLLKLSFLLELNLSK